MDVARLNFSHGTYDEHALSVTLVRAASARYQKPIAILADLPGPKIRTGTLEGGRRVMLRTGQRFTISTKMVSGNAEGVSVNYPRLAAEVRKGDRILLSDGLIELRVESSSGKRILCRVMSGGALGEHKGVNLPGVRLGVSAVTPLDRKHLAFALRQRRELHRRQLRAPRAGHPRRPGRRGPQRQEGHAHHRQAGKAGSNRQPRIDPGSERRRHGRPRGFGRRDEPGACARGAEDGHCPRARSPGAGDHRHADARIHDRASAPHARRGF